MADEPDGNEARVYARIASRYQDALKRIAAMPPEGHSWMYAREALEHRCGDANGIRRRSTEIVDEFVKAEASAASE